MGRFTRHFVVPLLVLAVPLGILAGLGLLSAERQLVRTRDDAIARTVDAVTALVADYQQALERETRLLASDPAVIEGTAKGDWAILARGASPRVLAVTQDGLADFIAIRDSRGAPLVQVPAGPPPSLPGMPSSTEPTTALRLAGGRPYFLVVAPITGATERAPFGAAGTVVAGRRLDGLAASLDRLPARPAVVFLVGDRALAASRSDLPAAGWTPAVGSGVVAVAGEPWALRRLESPLASSPDGALWVALSVRDFARAERRLLYEFLALVAGGAVVLAGVVAAFLPPRSRPRPVAGPPGENPRVVLERRNRELEALNAIATTIGRGANLETTARETLEVVRNLAGMDVGSVYQVDMAARELIMVAGSGFDPRFVEASRVRPLDGSRIGDAVRANQIQVRHLDAVPPAEEGLRQMAAERAHRTQLAIPIPVEQQTWGVMALVSKETREFSDEEMRILSSVAQQVGLAVERARLRDMAALRLSRLEAQRIIERHISEQLDTEELLVVIARSAQRLIVGGYAALYMLEGDTLRPRAWSDIGDWIRDLRFKTGTGVAGSTTMLTGRGVMVNDYPSSPNAMAEFVPFTSRLLAAPLMAGGRALGVMTAGRGPGAEPFTDEDLSTLTDFATQAAVAIEHARLFDEATRNAAQYQALLEVSGVVSSTLEVDRVLDLVVDRCQALLGVAALGVSRLDRSTGFLVYERGRGLSSEFLRTLQVRLGEGTTGGAAERREPVWTGDILHDPAVSLSPATRAIVEREGYRAVLSVPLLSKGEVLGAMAAYWWEPHTPSASEISVMTALAGQAAVALDNARLFAQERDRKASLSSLLEINKKIGALAAPETLLASIAEEAARLLEVDNAGFRLLDGDDLVVAGLFGTAAETMLRPRCRPGESMSGKVLSTGQALMCEIEGPDMFPDERAASEQLGYTHYLGVPLLMGERPIGVLTFRARRAFTAREQELAETFAGQAAIAIDHSRLYREASEQAERMRAVAELGRVLVSTLDEARVLELVATHARETLAMPDLAIWLREGGSDSMRFAVGQGQFSGPLSARARPLRMDEGVVGRALVERSPVWTSDVLADPRIRLSRESRHWIEEVGGRAILAVPLVREHLQGALVAYRAAGERFTEREVEYLSVFANQLAAALENARLYEALDARAARLRSLTRLAHIVSSSLDMDEVLRAIAEAAAELIAVPMAVFWVVDEAAQRLSVRTASDPLGLGLPAQQLSFGEGAAGWVARHRERLEIADVQSDPRVAGKDWAASRGLPSLLAVPIIAQDSLLGVLTLNGRGPIRLGPDDQQILDSFVAQAGVAIRNAGLYTQVQERLRETTALVAVGRALSQPDSPQNVMRAVARAVGAAFGADTVGIYTHDAKRDALVPLAGHHVPKDLLERFVTRSFVLSRSPDLAHVWRDGRAAWTADAHADPRFDDASLEGIPSHSALFAPATVRDEMVGVIFLVWWTTGREFSESEVRLVEGVAAQVGLGMENAELARQTEQKLQETETLLSVSQALASTLDVDALTRQFLRHVVNGLGADTAGVWLLEDNREWLVPFAGYRVPPEWLAAARHVRIRLTGDSFFGEGARGRRSMISTDAANDPRIPEDMRRAVPARTQLFVPIVAQEQMIGGFVAGWATEARELTEAELRLMEAVASQAGVALQNARLFQDNQRRVQELSVLHELSRAVTGQLDQAGLLDTVYQQVARVLEVRSMAVVLLEEEHNRLRVVLRVRDGQRCDEDEPHFYPRGAAGLTGTVFETGRPIRTTDYTADCARHGVVPLAAAIGMPYCLIVPMTADDRVLGVLALRSPDHAFTEADERLIANIAQLAALMLRSARLYEERTRAFGELAAAQDQLVRTEKLRALGEMASGVAHDFNNVLAAILGRAQLLLERVQDVKLRRWLQVIERAAMDGARTVRRLQDFTGIRRDQPAVAVDLNQVVQQVLEATESTWRQDARRRGVEIEVVTDLAEHLPSIAGDPAELREAFTNLVLNAVDAMSRGGRLTLRSSTPDGQAAVEVTDTGTGIPEAIRQKIFDPFFTTKGPKGTGLGLSMAYGILARHGGRITVESEEGRGTTFRLIFPPSEQAVEAAPAPAPPTDSSVALRCLVVDDEEEVAEVVADILTTAGHVAVVAESGQEAVDRFTAEPFDLVFTDLAMPGMTGWQVARAVKAKAPEVPVVMMSGFGVEVAPAELRTNGVDLVLAKPLQIQDVLRAVASTRRAGAGLP